MPADAPLDPPPARPLERVVPEPAPSDRLPPEFAIPAVEPVAESDVELDREPAARPPTAELVVGGEPGVLRPSTLLEAVPLPAVPAACGAAVA